MDRRILRTQQLLKEALLELATEKPIHTISVKELTNKAGLNRGTFYLHYQTMNEFCEQLKEEVLEQYYIIINQMDVFVDQTVFH